MGYSVVIIGHLFTDCTIKFFPFLEESGCLGNRNRASLAWLRHITTPSCVWSGGCGGGEGEGEDGMWWDFHLGREREHCRLESFTGSISAGTVKPVPDEVQQPFLPSAPDLLALRGAWGRGGQQASRRTPSCWQCSLSPAPVSLHTQRLGMLQTQQ